MAKGKTRTAPKRRSHGHSSQQAVLPVSATSAHAAIPKGKRLPALYRKEATALLVQARLALRDEEHRQQALQRCLKVLHAAPRGHFFRASLESVRVTPAPRSSRGSHTAQQLLPHWLAALQETRRRAEAIRLNMLRTLERMGCPIALWHFLAIDSLPETLNTLAPRTQQRGRQRRS